jgi:putative aldouronate transport system substrate-binding protein
MKKVLATALVVLMLVALAGCYTGTPAPTAPLEPATSASAAAGTAAPPTAPATLTGPVITWMYEGSNVVYDVDVMQKVNQYLNEKLGCRLSMMWQSWGDFDTKVMTSINAGDPVDIYFTCSWTADEYTAMSKKGAFLRLDDPANNLLEKAAPDLFKTLPQVLADAAMVQGAAGLGIYAIPTYKEIGQQYVWSFNSEILKKYGYTADDITDFYTLDPVLEKIKQGEGVDFFPLNADFTVVERAVRNVDAVDPYNLLDYPFDPVNPSKSGTAVRSAFETEDMQKYLTKIHEYFLKGYVNPAATTNTLAMQTCWTDTKKSGKWAIDIYPYVPGNEVSETATFGYQFEVKPVQAGIISTTSARGAMNAVSSTSPNPELALKVINLVNSDAAFRTLLTYGIEDLHYTKLDNGKIKFTDEKKNYNVWAYGLAAVTLLPLQDGMADNLYTEVFPKFNGAEAVPILGWALDMEPIKTQMAALHNIDTQYEVSLFTGAADPAVKLPEFVQQLKANGIDDVLKEANNQIQAYLAANPKK